MHKKKIARLRRAIFLSSMGKEFFHKLDRFLFGCDPMNIFVSLEPGHLALRISNDIVPKLFQHLFAGDEFAKISADPSVFETEAVEAVPTDTVRMKSFDFFEHARFDAFVQASFDQRAQCFLRARNADQKEIVWR